MRALICTFEGCQSKATVRCFCKNPELLLCLEHLGNHLINSPGKHNYDKLLDDPFLQTKHDVLHYMQNEIQILEDLKRNLSLKVHSAIINLKNNLESYNDKIDLEIKSFVENMSQVLNILENSNKSVNLEYLKLPPSEAVDYVKTSHVSSISTIPIEELISEVYKNIGLVKLSELQEILNKNKELEVEIYRIKGSMNQLTQNNAKEGEEFKQSYEALKAKEMELVKSIEILEESNKYLKNMYDELYKKYQDLESRNNSGAQFLRSSTLPGPDQNLLTQKFLIRHAKPHILKKK